MRIGDVAREAGVNIQTLRYYERRGLIAEPQRRPSGYRDYSDATPQQVRFIKRAQDLGFTLAEIGELLALRSLVTRRRPETRNFAVAKVATIDRKIAELAAMRSALALLIDACESSAQTLACPIIEALDTSPTTVSTDGVHG